ncbi:ABC-2 type transporter-domain-containing protein [Roridomyces roridus]|uniref:ABC-2 type transporter-domain-containing protein n=1 Tax=Roridomyces roridus TaxID=1738132 RepID=A0AAD7B500_9AGAR|nr:ABC-2 type transporter-domain-containing protein [Roridomyces roridus]
MADTPGDAATLNEAPHPVDVPTAEAEFKELARQLTQHSGNHKYTPTDSSDLEKGVVDAPFDLREYLTSSNDAQQAAGIKHVGVTWDDLEVRVAGGVGSKVYVGTFAGACMDFALGVPRLIWGLASPLVTKEAGVTRTILHKSSGILKAGEMCLVLGCPGSGCTTFLKAIANERTTFVVDGDVLYEGIDAETMHKYYKGEVVFNDEDDIHIATLTVAQTLAFALSCKTPGPNGRLPGLSRKEFDKQVLETLLKMLNISHTHQTLVGDEFVRGVSGGERKRVSIAEMMATRARVQSWDNSTRGLDASTALDFAKCLRIMTDVLGQTTFVSLYQAGEGIYDQFDKVMVLAEGRTVFYGPPTEARAYFEGLGYRSLPRQSTADYLTGCTDVNERQFAPGRSAADVPSTPEALEDAFKSSRFSQDLEDSREKYKLLVETEKSDQEAFRAAVAADKKKGVSKKSPYTLGFVGQVRALTRRQFQMRLQDKFQLYTSFSLAMILALVAGAAYINQPLTAAGAFTRGGVIFVILLTTCLDAFGEMPTQMLGRPILQKQTAYSMYRPSAIAVANTLADVPFSAVRIFLFNLVVYFMTGLDRSAGGFFTFHLFAYVAFLTMQGFFRTLGLICTSFHTAIRLSVFFIPNLWYCGYLLPVFKMKRWLFWIYYINPIGYAWQACMENEFMRISLTCDGSYVVPRNIGSILRYPENLGPNQVCTLFGSTAGSTVVSGRDYIKVAFGLDANDIWRRNFLVLVGFFIVFQATQIIALEYFPQYNGGSAIAIYAKENKDTKERNEILRARKAERRGKSQAELKDVQKEEKGAIPSQKKILTWENLNYHVPVPGGTRRLLHDVQGYVGPGLTALMGASGAGKTTCLDVLAQRKNIGVITGDLLVGGRPLTSDFARGTAYAEQMDVHELTATVREALRFSAYLRQPAEVSKEEKDDYVEEMLELLELQDLSEALVLSLSVEARKRLTIGVELASKPGLLLYLDEPTSGLDSQSAYNLVRFLRRLADQGQAILCTIHQPSALLFESFDRLLLLERGGETVYFGPIGQDSQEIRNYFAKGGAVCPSNVNPAEYMLEAIGAGVTPRVGDRDWKDIWLDSAECQKLRDDIAAFKAAALALPDDSNKKMSTYATSFSTQLRLVTERNFVALWRSPDYLFTRFFVCTFISFFVSLSLLQLGNSVRDLQFRVFAIFWVTILPAIVMAQIEPMFILNRRVFIREASSRIYSPYVFSIAQTISEIPGSILTAICYWVLLVYPVGFGNGSAGLNGTGFQLLVTIIMMLFGVSLGQFIGAISPSIQVAALFNPFLSLVFTTFCGVTIPHTSGHFWWTWLYQLVPYTRSVAAMVSTELHGLVIKCNSDEFAVFNPPSGQNCSQWAADFVTAAGGYLDNADATENCRYCTYAVGDEFYTPLGITYGHRWRDVFIFLAYAGFNVIITVIASRYLRYAKR